MPITVMIAILLALTIGFVIIRRSNPNKNVPARHQAPSPLRNGLQAKTDIEAALEFETYKQQKETSVNLLQHEITENQRKFAKQYHNDFEKVKSEIQSGFIHVQKENQIHLKKANEKMQDWIKDLLHGQRKELQNLFQKTTDNFKLEIQSELQNTEQHIQSDLRVARQFVKEEIQKAILKATPVAAPKAIPKATAAETSKELTVVNFEKQLNKIEKTENQLQTNIFNELNHQLADTQNIMAQIQTHLEMLHLLHEMECEFSTQATSE